MDETQARFQPMRCPTCKGRGLVNWEKEICGSCGGKGVIVVDQETGQLVVGEDNENKNNLP